MAARGRKLQGPVVNASGIRAESARPPSALTRWRYDALDTPDAHAAQRKPGRKGAERRQREEEQRRTVASLYH